MTISVDLIVVRASDLVDTLDRVPLKQKAQVARSAPP
jgi:hypothetical protein